MYSRPKSTFLKFNHLIIFQADYTALSVLLSEYDAREITVDIFVSDLLNLISDQEKVITCYTASIREFGPREALESKSLRN